MQEYTIMTKGSTFNIILERNLRFILQKNNLRSHHYCLEKNRHLKKHLTGDWIIFPSILLAKINHSDKQTIWTCLRVKLLPKPIWNENMFSIEKKPLKLFFALIKRKVLCSSDVTAALCANLYSGCHFYSEKKQLYCHHTQCRWKRTNTYLQE